MRTIDRASESLRALLRAAAHGPLRIMFPFVSGVEQIRAARRMVTEYGMSDRLGPIALGRRHGNPFLGRDLAGAGVGA